MVVSRSSIIDNTGVLVACTFGMGISCLTLANYALGPFIYPLHQAFGWSRGQIALGYSLITVVTLLTTVLIGAICDLISPRWLVVPSQIAFGLGYVGVGLLANDDLRRFYALHFVLALLAAGGLPMTFSRLVARRFVSNKGLALGAINTGSGFCGMFIPPYIAIVIEHFGWRGGYIALGLIPILGALLLSLPFLSEASPLPLSGNLDEAGRGLTLGQAIRGYRLWLIALSLAIGAGLSTAVVSSLIPLLRDHHVGAVAAAGTLSVFGFSVIVGRIGVGALIDRFWAPPIAVAFMVPAGLSLLVLALAPLTGIVIYGCAIVLGLAAGAELDMLWFLGARYFGLAHIGKIYSFLYVCLTLGIVISTPIFSLVFDRFGDYRPALFGGAAAWVLCGGVLLTLGPYPDRRAWGAQHPLAAVTT